MKPILDIGADNASVVPIGITPEEIKRRTLSLEKLSLTTLLKFLLVGHSNRKEMQDKLKVLGYPSKAQSNLQSSFTKISEGNVYGRHRILYTYTTIMMFTFIIIISFSNHFTSWPLGVYINILLCNLYLMLT